MGAGFRLWWQQIKKHRVAIGVVAMVLVVAMTLIIVGYWFDWAGFNGYNKVTIAHTISGTNVGTVIRTEEYQPGRTLWDWSQLLIIPAVLAVGGFVINLTISRSEQEATKQRAQSEREIAEVNQYEAALQAYIDKMSELLLEKKLRDSKPEDEVRKIARVRTLTVLPRLDNRRKKSILQFLYESGLIEMDKSIIDLQGADLSRADLSRADLSRAILEGADLRGANLHEAIMEGTNLKGANLEGANLSGPILRLVGLDVNDPVAAMLMEANLTGADLSRACLIRAYLNEANLKGANLYGADLNGANLEGADLSGANLEGTDLGRANLRLTNVTFEQLNQAMSLQNATMPDGSKHP